MSEKLNLDFRRSAELLTKLVFIIG